MYNFNVLSIFPSITEIPQIYLLMNRDICTRCFADFLLWLYALTYPQLFQVLMDVSIGVTLNIVCLHDWQSISCVYHPLFLSAQEMMLA